jgi:hypothetical protein
MDMLFYDVDYLNQTICPAFLKETNSKPDVDVVW